jgi:membrane protein DedA with SNARE-associated domain
MPALPKSKSADTEDHAEKPEAWSRRYGKWLLPFACFVPGLRLLVAMIAGVTKLSMPVFAAFAHSGAPRLVCHVRLPGIHLGRELGIRYERYSPAYCFRGSDGHRFAGSVDSPEVHNPQTETVSASIEERSVVCGR